MVTAGLDVVFVFCCHYRYHQLDRRGVLFCSGMSKDALPGPSFCTSTYQSGWNVTVGFAGLFD